MEKILESVVTFLIGSVAGVMLKNWFDYKLMVYEELWKKRFDAYRQVFQISSALPLYPEPARLNHEDMKTVSEELRDWYFEGGGLLLSSVTRDIYFEVQESIQIVLKNSAPEKFVSDTDYTAVRKNFSRLRTEFSNDLMSRRRVKMLSPLSRSSGN
ncbi:MAG: hypothetical protein JNM22_05370 [Saprospiraceae bacterium]|nr:hypothetical protein [Saprospiraceae bacterium]